MNERTGYTVVVYANDLKFYSEPGGGVDLGNNTIARLLAIFDETGHLHKEVNAIVLTAGIKKELSGEMDKTMAVMMKDWLVKRGVPEFIIHTSNESKHRFVWGTWEESVLAFEIIKAKKLGTNIMVVSHRWHIWPRLMMVWWAIAVDEPFVCQEVSYCYAYHEYPFWQRLRHETLATLWYIPKCFCRVMLSNS